jgi:hypothetical protein
MAPKSRGRLRLEFPPLAKHAQGRSGARFR